MRIRKLTLVSLFSCIYLICASGCKNTAENGGNLQQITVQTSKISTVQENNSKYSTKAITIFEKQKTSTDVKSTGIVTNGTGRNSEITNVTTVAQQTEADNTVTGKVEYTNTSLPSTENEQPVVNEEKTEVPSNTVTTTEFVEPTTEKEITIPNDSLVIKEVVIKLAYGDASNQANIDNNDAVYDTASISNDLNDLIFGHKEYSFNILDSMQVGEKFAMNNHGKLKYYQVQKTGRAILNENHSDATYIGETEQLYYHDFGYHGLILVTCDKQDAENHRWVIVAKEVE